MSMPTISSLSAAASPNLLPAAHARAAAIGAADSAPTYASSSQPNTHSPHAASTPDAAARTRACSDRSSAGNSVALSREAEAFLADILAPSSAARSEVGGARGCGPSAFASVASTAQASGTLSSEPPPWPAAAPPAELPPACGSPGAERAKPPPSSSSAQSSPSAVLNSHAARPFAVSSSCCVDRPCPTCCCAELPHAVLVAATVPTTPAGPPAATDPATGVRSPSVRSTRVIAGAAAAPDFRGPCVRPPWASRATRPLAELASLARTRAASKARESPVSSRSTLSACRLSSARVPAGACAADGCGSCEKLGEEESLGGVESRVAYGGSSKSRLSNASMRPTSPARLSFESGSAGSSSLAPMSATGSSKGGAPPNRRDVADKDCARAARAGARCKSGSSHSRTGERPVSALHATRTTSSGAGPAAPRPPPPPRPPPRPRPPPASAAPPTPPTPALGLAASTSAMSRNAPPSAPAATCAALPSAVGGSEGSAPAVAAAAAAAAAMVRRASSAGTRGFGLRALSKTAQTSSPFATPASCSAASTAAAPAPAETEALASLAGSRSRTRRPGCRKDAQCERTAASKRNVRRHSSRRVRNASSHCPDASEKVPRTPGESRATPLACAPAPGMAACTCPAFATSPARARA
mmetsp:Transcript_9161/g.22074  ORF Transcript_9161/g.22074 Transcript_9161/m.22074 type:complete len:644 (+) Transcript_9161:606-2537(+)